MSSATDVGRLEALARTYRLLLLDYPKSWRTVYGDEVLAVLLELATDRGQARPDCSEVGSLLGNGLMMRVEGLLGFCSARTRERTAVVAGVGAAAAGMVALVLGEWIPWRAGAPLTGFGTEYDLVPHPGLGAVPAVMAIAGVVLMLSGRARRGQAVFAAGAAVTAVIPVLTAVTDLNRPPHLYLASVFGLLLFAAAAPVRLRGAQRRAVGWIMVLLGAAVIVVGTGLSSWAGWIGPFYYRSGGFYQLNALVVWLTVPTMLVLLAVPRLRSWAAPVAVACVPWWAQAALIARQISPAMGGDTFLLGCALGVILLGCASRIASSYTLSVRRTGR